MNTQHWADLFCIHLRLKNHDIDCRIELVKMISAEKYDRETAMRVMFVYIDEKVKMRSKKV